MFQKFRTHDYSTTVTWVYSRGQKYWHPLEVLLNMIKEGCEIDSALLIRLIFYLSNSQKNLTFH